jgi:hypothetical protein
VQQLLPWKSNKNYIFECVSVAFVIQHAIRHITLSPVACPALQNFFTSHKRQIIEKMLLNIKCGLRFSLQIVSETFLILRITQRDIINMHRSSCKVPVILVRF